MRHQFCAGFLRRTSTGEETPITVRLVLHHLLLPKLHLWPHSSYYHSPGFQSLLPSHARHVLSLRIGKAPILAAFPNTLCLPPLSKAFTSLSSALNITFHLCSTMVPSEHPKHSCARSSPKSIDFTTFNVSVCHVLTLLLNPV